MTRYDIHDKLAFGPQSLLMVQFLAKLDKRHIAYNGTTDSDGTRWVDHADKGLRFVAKAHDVEDSYIRHTGWYLDDDGMGETCWGVVYQLPARNGDPQFIPGYTNSYNEDGACLDFTNICDTAKDAASYADRLAEAYSEAEREYQRKSQAEMRIEDIGIEIADAYKSCRALCAEVRANCAKLDGLSVLRGLIKAEVRRTRCALRKLYKERAELRSEWRLA